MSQPEGSSADIFINKQAPDHNTIMHCDLIITRAYNSYHKFIGGGGSDALIVIAMTPFL